MCRYSVNIDDAVLKSVKPYFKNDDVMQLWIEQQLHQAILQYMKGHSTSVGAKGSADVLEKLEAIKDDPKGFFKLDQILPPSSMSPEELKDEAYYEKYGI